MTFRLARQVCALPAQTCAPFALKRTGKLSHSLRHKKNRVFKRDFFCGGESGIRTHEALYGGLHDFESCAFNRAPPSLQLRLPFNNTLFYPDCKAFILTFQPLCLICHLPLYRRRYLPLVFLFYFSSLYSLYSLLFFLFPFISFMHTIYSNILYYFIQCALLCLSVLLLTLSFFLLFPARFYVFYLFYVYYVFYAFLLFFRCFGFTTFIEKASSEAFSFTPFIFKFSVFGFPVSFFSVPCFRFLNFRSTSSVPSTYRRSFLPIMSLDRKFAFTGQIDVQLPEDLQGTFGQHHRRMSFASGKFG